jgi:hypothetical protein
MWENGNDGRVSLVFGFYSETSIKRLTSPVLIFFTCERGNNVYFPELFYIIFLKIDFPLSVLRIKIQTEHHSLM